ncbi:MAG: DNA polymerase III subunit gamma/tau [Bacillota bacterium]|nr:DNA polymerase III subunit gamma/tau [Bacillota bacterium]
MYREWRPRTFAEVVGQEHVVRALRRAVAEGRVAHAYCFAGPRGTGKTSVARILARAVNCLRPEEGEPCNACRPCAEALEGSFLDLVEIDAASNRGIDQMRELLERVHLAPVEGRRKVYIIDEAHMLTPDAFNAFLKTLEEPPAHTLFVLATTEPQKVPVTILSRCQRFDFHRIEEERIARHLAHVAESLGASMEPAALAAVARYAEGGLRDALSLLDECLAAGARTVDDVAAVLGTAPSQALEALSGALARGDAGGLLATVRELAQEGKDFRQVLLDLTAYLREELLRLLEGNQAAAAAPAPGPARSGTAAAPGAQESHPWRAETLLATLEALADLEGEMRWAARPRARFELGLLAAMERAGHPLAPAGGPLEQTGADPEGPVAGGGASPRPAEPAKPSGRASTDERDEPEDKPDETRRGAAPGSPAQAAAPAAGEIDLRRVEEIWPEVVRRARRRSAKLAAFLDPAKLGGIQGDALVLEFPPLYEFHCQQLAETPQREMLEEVLSELLGRRLAIKSRLEEAEPETGLAPAVRQVLEKLGPDVRVREEIREQVEPADRRRRSRPGEEARA